MTMTSNGFENKKILLRAYGNSVQGMGHIARSSCLAEALASRGANSFFLLKKSESESRNYLESRHVSDNHILDYEADLSQFSALIYDAPNPDRSLAGRFKLGNPDSLLLALDCDDSSDENFDIFLYLFEHTRILPGKKLNRHSKFVCDLNFALIRSDFFPFRPAGPSANKEISRVLVSFGGADPKIYSLLVPQIAERFPDIRFEIVAGHAFSHETELGKAVSIHKSRGAKVFLLKTLPSLAPAISASDLVICGGGGTMLESIYLGCPAIVITQSADELSFASSVSSKGACALSESPDTEKIIELFEKLKRCEVRSKISSLALSVLDGKGADRIAGIILENLPAH